MGKSARASVTKRNNSALKKKVFGPVEDARSERLSAKLMAIINQPKPEREEMVVDGKEAAMDVDTKKISKTNKATSSAGRIQKSRHRKARNEIAFKKHPMKKKKQRKS